MTNKIMPPKVLFSSYMCHGSEPMVQSILNKWKELNPTFEVKYFSDEDVKQFFEKSDFYSVYNGMVNGVAIADFFRICYIYKYGGVYKSILQEKEALKRCSQKMILKESMKDWIFSHRP